MSLYTAVFAGLSLILDLHPVLTIYFKMLKRYILILFFSAGVLKAHQPVMDMAPRWAGGSGLQIRHIWFGSDELLAYEDQVSNSLGLSHDVNQTWFEGVYTFDRSFRVTAKLPYLEQSRLRPSGAGTVFEQNSGWGDLILGMPLKRYTNASRATWNLGFTPSLRLPTGSSSGDLPLSDGSLDLGLSFSYSYEGYPWESHPDRLFYQLYDAFVWINGEGERGMREGNVFGLDINWGIKPIFDDETVTGTYLMWDLSARHARSSDTLTTPLSGSRVHTGPVFVQYWGSTMFRVEWKFPVWERADGMALSRGDEFNIGIGRAF